MVKPQIKVGFLVMIGLICFGIVIITLGNVSLERGYEFYIIFDSIADLPEHSVVKISGVDVGRIRNIKLYKGKARVKVWIQHEVKIYKNAKPEIKRVGLIGNTYLSLTQGTTQYPRIEKGDTIKGISPLSYEEVVDRLISGLDKVSNVFERFGRNKEFSSDIVETFSNLKMITRGLNSALGKDGEKLSRSVNNMNQVMGNINTALTASVGEIESSMYEIRKLTEELTNILKKIRQGEGTVGRLISSEEYGEKVGKTIDSIYDASVDLKQAVNRYKGFDTVWNTGLSYEPDNGMFRTSSGLLFRTNARRFLSLGIENIRDDKKEYDKGGDKINSITIKAGKRFGDFGVFGGAIRSSGGMGADWNFKDRVKIETEVFEFSDDLPKWNLSSNLLLFDFLSIGASYEDILEEKSFRTILEVEVK
ncbi:MAG: MlaD family protein [Elusimicrobiota bacterium]